MDCNNKYCYWHYKNQCCHEDEESYDNATPNELDCPSSLRSDFEIMMRVLINECYELLGKRRFRELVDIHNFIINQRRSIIWKKDC